MTVWTGRVCGDGAGHQRPPPNGAIRIGVVPVEERAVVLCRELCFGPLRVTIV